MFLLRSFTFILAFQSFTYGFKVDFKVLPVIDRFHFSTDPNYQNPGAPQYGSWDTRSPEFQARFSQSGGLKEFVERQAPSPWKFRPQQQGHQWPQQQVHQWPQQQVHQWPQQQVHQWPQQQVQQWEGFMQTLRQYDQQQQQRGENFRDYPAANQGTQQNWNWG